MKELARRSFMNSGGPMRSSRFKAALSMLHEDGFVEMARPISNLYPPSFEDETSPAEIIVDDEDDDWSMDDFSDEVGYDFIDWDDSPDWDELTKQQCTNTCATEQADGYQTCDQLGALAFGAGIVGTAGATVISTWVGGLSGARATVLAGIALTTAGANAYNYACKAAYAKRNAACQATCN